MDGAVTAPAADAVLPRLVGSDRNLMSDGRAELWSDTGRECADVCWPVTGSSSGLV